MLPLPSNPVPILFPDEPTQVMLVLSRLSPLPGVASCLGSVSKVLLLHLKGIWCNCCICGRLHTYMDPGVWEQAALLQGPGAGRPPSPTLAKHSLDTASVVQPGGSLRNHLIPCLHTCAIHLGVTGLSRPPALSLCLLHLGHVEVSLPRQRAHETDLVMLVDFQPRMGTQLPLLAGQGQNQK